MTMPRLGRIAPGAALAVVLAACEGPAPTAADFVLPAERVPGVAEVETRRIVSDDAPTRASADGRALDALRQRSIVSSADLRYRFAKAGTCKVRVDVFRDEAAARSDWRTRHHPEALSLTVPFDAGDEGWIWRDRMAAFRAGTVIVEFRASDDAAGMPDLARRYAAFVRGKLAT